MKPISNLGVQSIIDNAIDTMWNEIFRNVQEHAGIEIGDVAAIYARDNAHKLQWIAAKITACTHEYVALEHDYNQPE